MDSLYQTVNELVGNIDWGESLTLAACEFPGLNSFGARRRAVELNFPKPSYQQMFEAFNLTQVFAVSGAILERQFSPSIPFVYLCSWLVINPTLYLLGKLGHL